MKRFYSISILCFVALITMLSCERRNDIPSKAITPVATPGPSLNQLFADLRYTPQNIDVTAGTDIIVFGASGTMLHFYSNSFKDAAGNIITSGTVSLQLVEMYQPGDMIRNRTTTMSNGQLLQSGGEIAISATMNGQTVYANKYGIGFKQATASTQHMQLFYGNTSNADSVVTWEISDTAKPGNIANGTEKIDTINTNGFSYTFVGYLFDSCNKFAFINCDHFRSDSGSKTSVSIIVPDSSFDPTVTQFYLVFPTINCVMSDIVGVIKWNAVTHTMTMIGGGTANEIAPIGMNYEIAVIANKNGGPYYYYQASGVTTKGMTINAAMVRDDLGDIQKRMAGL